MVEKASSQWLLTFTEKAKDPLSSPCENKEVIDNIDVAGYNGACL